MMTDDELKEFDQTVENFRSTAIDAASLPVPELPGFWSSLKGIGAQLNLNPPSVLARDRLRQMSDMFKVMMASRPLISTSAEAARYADAVQRLQREYQQATNAYLASTSAAYELTANIRAATQTLTEALQRVKNNTAALSTVADAISGAAALVKALS